MKVTKKGYYRGNVEWTHEVDRSTMEVYLSYEKFNELGGMIMYDLFLKKYSKAARKKRILKKWRRRFGLNEDILGHDEFWGEVRDA